MVISAFVFFYRDITDYNQFKADEQTIQEIADFNKSYDSYTKEIYGSQLLSLTNKIKDYNTKINTYRSSYKGYKEIYLEVTLKNGEKKDVTYFDDMMESFNKAMEFYQSTNYLETLYKVYIEYPNDTSAEIQKQAVLNKIGKSENDIVKNNLKKDYNSYLEYKQLKNNKFNITNIEYYENGRIKKMSYQQM